MDAKSWQQLKAVLADALEHESPSARTAIVNEACADDPELLKQAHSLLDSVVDTDDEFEECADKLGAVLRPPKAAATGDRLGAYVIVRELGQGGMGTVYLAVRADGYFEKQVAIKVLKPGTDTFELLRRFRAEREVLAAFDHPHIASLFDAGTTVGGLPYFVMEYVPGITLSAYLSEKHLTIPERLQLFLKICGAVEAAHRHRVVHRDLKASNILVNGEGEPKLLDFGIAKLLDEDSNAVTASGQERLSLICASPEQATGKEVTFVSDIYALGTLLYWMLTRRAPHVFASPRPPFTEMATVLCTQEPLLPSLAAVQVEESKILRGDLDAIVLKAMQKDPARRYASAAAFSKDILRYSARESVEARPDTLTVRARRYLTRYRTAIPWLTLGGVILVLALAIGAYYASNETQSLVKAPSVPPKSIAVLPFGTSAVDKEDSDFVDGVQDDILTDLTKVSDLKVISRSGVAPYGKGPRKIREIGLQLGVAYVLEGSVRKQKDRVRVYAQLIDTTTEAEVWAEHYDRKIDDLFALQSEVAQKIVAQLQAKLSDVEKAAFQTRPTKDAQAYDFYLQGKGAFLQYHYLKSVDLLNQAVARDPEFALAYCLLAEANLYAYRLGGDQTDVRLDKARTAAEAAHRIDPELPESHLAQAQYYYYGLQDYEKAVAELTSAAPALADRAKFYDLNALAEKRLGRWKQALHDGEKAMELDPYNPYIAGEVVQSYRYLREFSKAEKLADRAIEMMPVEAATFWGLKAESFIGRGDTKKARLILEAAPHDAEGRDIELAVVAAYDRDYAKALGYVEASRGTQLPTPDPSVELLEGTIARYQGDLGKAKALFGKVRDELKAHLQKHPDDPAALRDLGVADAGLGRKEEALAAAERSLQLVPIWRDAVEGPQYASTCAQTKAWVGEKDAAITQLFGIVKLAGGPDYGELKLDPGWDDLRGDPRFEEIIEEARKPVKVD